MHIYDFADLIGKELIITRFPQQDNRFIAQFDESEVKENERSPYLSGTYGDGKSPTAAIKDYVRNIKGKILIFNAMDTDRQKFHVPKDLSV